MSDTQLLEKIIDKLDKIEDNQRELKEDLQELKDETEIISLTVNRIESNLNNHTHEVGKIKLVNE